ncbi:MAG: hypothetical protein FJX47_06480 [Alphaproteobacteria bacterium]|nr:hypothetical protein [Alphaproteobacteria bacterium]
MEWPRSKGGKPPEPAKAGKPPAAPSPEPVEAKPSGKADIQLAIALAYEPGKDQAPKVAATGKGQIAEQIIQVALAHGVEVRRDEDLAMILSKLDIDAYVPLEVYATIAEILSYVYKVNAEKRWKLNVK